MRVFEFTFFVPFDPHLTMGGYSEILSKSRVLIDPVGDPWGHPLYRNSKLAEDIRENRRPRVGMTVHKLDGSDLGLMIRLDPDPTDRYHQTYRCCRRLAAAQWEHATERYTATRPWVIVTANLIVMRGAATRGEALRNAFIKFPAPTVEHDPGAQPEGDDAAALEGWR